MSKRDNKYRVKSNGKFLDPEYIDNPTLGILIACDIVELIVGVEEPKSLEERL